MKLRSKRPTTPQTGEGRDPKAAIITGIRATPHKSGLRLEIHYVLGKKPRVIRYPKPRVDHRKVDLREANETELLEICRQQGMQTACPGMPREVLLDSLNEMVEPPAVDPLAEKRERLRRWLTRHWDKFAQQAPELPALLKQPDDMLNAALVSDSEVIHLWKENEHQLRWDV